MRWLIALVALLAIALAAGSWWRSRVNNWGVVEPGEIYRSGQLSRHVIRQVLAKNKIATIVALGADKDGGPDIAAEQKAARDLGIDRHDYGLNGDGIGDPEVYVKAIDVIVRSTQQGKPVLVHCHSGGQRTGGVIAVYRMLIERKTPQEAYAEMRRYGFDIRTNPGLIPFLNANMAHWVTELRQRKVIDAAPAVLPKIVP
jgi:protein tyrosine/serine phosphatase